MAPKKKYTQQDLSFATDQRDMVMLETPKGARALVYMVVLFFAVLITWSFIAEIDEVKKGEGVAVPIHQIQEIQNLEGGIVDVLNVAEGDVVTKGQVLVELDDVQFSSSEEEIVTEMNGLLARSDRLLAEAEHKTLDLAFYIDKYPTIAESEVRVYQSKKAQLENELNVLDSKFIQKEKEISELEGQIRSTQEQLKLAQKESSLLAKLEGTGATSEVEVIQAKQKVTEYQKELDSDRRRLERVKEEKTEISQSIEQAKSEFATKALEERNEVILKIKKLEAQREGLTDKRTRAKVIAPLDGIIKKLEVDTIGGIVQPGMTMMELVPMGDKLLVETKIRPKDIGFIHPGMKAKVKFTAYDFATYGGLDGVVKQISADAITNDKGESFFIVKVETAKSYLGKEEDDLPVIPGMRAEVDIMVSKKTIMSYFFKPILRAVQ